MGSDRRQTLAFICSSSGHRPISGHRTTERQSTDRPGRR
jgi:hypothetical protein